MAGSGLLLVIVVAVTLLDGVLLGVEAQQFSLTHKWAHLEGSPARSGGNGMVSQEYFEKLVAHDRRRLASFVTFGLRGSFLSTALYHTQISLGTPPRQFSVFVDTGSDVTWVSCAPCNSCPLQTNIEGVSLIPYDPAQSSTEQVLPCASSACQIISEATNPECTDSVSPNACDYEINYVDGSGTNGYFINDVLTFNMVVNGTDTASTANVYFGCGHNQTGGLLDESVAVDGLMGLGVADITIPNQIAAQKNTSRMFAHCLQGDTDGGGVIVMGNITEPGVVYTPMVPDQSHFNVRMQNIAVNGVNITTLGALDVQEIPLGNGFARVTGGVVMDSGTTYVLLIQPVYEEFVPAVVRNAPTATVFNSGPRNGDYYCFSYTGSLDAVFPEVTLFFDGGAVMNLTPRNYMRTFRSTSGDVYACIVWVPSTAVTILGDIVLQDQLVVHDIDNQRVGWIQNFNCSRPIAVGASTYTAPSSSEDPSFSSGSPETRTSIYLLYSCLAVAACLLSNVL